MSVPAQPSEPAFRFVAAAILSRHQQGSQATNATGRPAAWQIVKQRACSGYFGRTDRAPTFADTPFGDPGDALPPLLFLPGSPNGVSANVEARSVRPKYPLHARCF